MERKSHNPRTKQAREERSFVTFGPKGKRIQKKYFKKMKNKKVRKRKSGEFSKRHNSRTKIRTKRGFKMRPSKRKLSKAKGSYDNLKKIGPNST